LWEQLNTLYEGLNPLTAEGVQLTNIGYLTGFQRLLATATTVDAILLGTDATVVPALSRAKTSFNDNSYELIEDATISKSSAIKGIVTITTPIVVLGDYNFTVNGITISYVAQSFDSTTSVSAKLAYEINSNATLSAVLTATVPDTATNTIVLLSKDYKTSFSFDIVSNVTISEIWSYGKFRSTVLGKISAIIGSLDTIDTPVTGWLSVTNLLSGQRGRDDEDDISFRFRRGKSFSVAGVSSPLGIEAKLSQLSNVANVRVFENPTDSTDEFGRPRHCINVCIEGGDDNDIANAIYLYKPAGIDTFGATEVIIADSQGETYPVSFDRFLDRFGWVRVTILAKNFEEVYPQNGADIIRKAIYDFASKSFSFGDDVILQKFYSPVYSVKGLKEVKIEVAVTDLENDSPVWVEENISISPKEAVRFALENNRIVIIDNIS
jgi:uncharacterized phage protein gp47/JayE